MKKVCFSGQIMVVLYEVMKYSTNRQTVNPLIYLARGFTDSLVE